MQVEPAGSPDRDPEARRLASGKYSDFTSPFFVFVCNFSDCRIVGRIKRSSFVSRRVAGSNAARVMRLTFA